jgi:hypothetical protein
MEIDISSLLETDLFPLSHSRAEGGENAGENTWQASLDHAEETALLDTPEKFQAIRDFARSSGGWTQEEIDAWTPQEVNALFLQWIAGDCRQCPAILPGVAFGSSRTGETVAHWYKRDGETIGIFESRSEAYADACPQGRMPRAESLEEIDWEEYETQATAGQIPTNIFRADDGRIFFSLYE